MRVMFYNLGTGQCQIWVDDVLRATITAPSGIVTAPFLTLWTENNADNAINSCDLTNAYFHAIEA
jgi:hypothetical protein